MAPPGAGRLAYVSLTSVVTATLVGVIVSGATTQPPSQDSDKAQFEAAFQGRCGEESPCEQLCYELHDGMFECDCRQGFNLHHDGYSCVEVNGTVESLAVGLEEEEEGEDVLYEKEAWFSAELATGPPTSPEPPPCHLHCGPFASCVLEDSVPRCQCPLGRAPPHCTAEVVVESPRFTGEGWLAFPALKAAYKNVQLEMEFRPEALEGIMFLTGERDDLAGDFMALLLYQGFVEFRFDCGSGVGVVRSDETVLLNQWNKITLYRHKWDAWIQLNGGSRLQGRSKGLFSRMTFREPVFIGGRGNTSGLQGKLPTERGFKGCLSHLQINDHVYNFAPAPRGEALQGYDIEECIADSCSKIVCQHGGKCVMNNDFASCLCPLGYTGTLCQKRLELQVPAFNGSSYLRYAGIGGSALSWLDISLVLKPTSDNGLILYNGHRADGVGDFIALLIKDSHIEFTFDLGTGPATLRSTERIKLEEWQEVKVSRTGRLAVLQIDDGPSTQILSPGAFTQLFLPLDLYIGGVPNFDMVSPKVKVKTSFVGCIQKVTINNRELQILAEALAGVNIDNCRHACVTLHPCRDGEECIPVRGSYNCVCSNACRNANMIPSSTISATASFTGNTYLHYTDPNIINRVISDKVVISLKLRTTSSSGLIIWTGPADFSQSITDFLSIALQGGFVHLRYNLGSGEALIVYNTTTVSDGNWHSVKASRYQQEGSLSVDNGPSMQMKSPGKLKQLNTNSGLHIGGMENMESATHFKYQKGFHGCISDLILNSDFRVKLAWSNDSSDQCLNLAP